MRIAVVGGGISGLGATYLLARAHEVTLFEREGRAGGHTHTIRHRGLALDTGFLVHNVPNYPLLGRLFAELGVETAPSHMSFSVSCGSCGLEYAGRRPFAQLRNAASPGFQALLWEIVRWLRTARASLEQQDYETSSLQEYLERRGYSERFARHFIIPLTSALWSTAPGRALEFPAAYAIRFFDNHGMLGLRRFRWRTVRGGSDTYVRALTARLGPSVRLGLGVRALRRSAGGVELTTDDGERHDFDKVVVATHADQALALLVDPSAEERRVLGAFGYSHNAAVLHTDATLLPRAPGARASWNVRTDGAGGASVTYSLNRLQSLEGPLEYLVTLNGAVAEDQVIARLAYDHPLYTVESMRAQPALRALSGERHTLYAGAHHGNGFHEDGLASAVRAAAALGVDW